MRVARRNANVLLAIAVLAVGAGVVVALLVRPPTAFTCSTPDTQACLDTERWIRSHAGLVFAADGLPGRLVAVDIRPTPTGRGCRPMARITGLR